MKAGSWVKVGDQVGIVTGLSEGGVSVDLVDTNGETVGSDLVDNVDVMVAAPSDVPVIRRTPPKAQLSEPISDEENERKTAAILAGEYTE